jgi:hypothetical protein
LPQSARAFPSAWKKYFVCSHAVNAHPEAEARLSQTRRSGILRSACPSMTIEVMKCAAT